MTVLDLHTTRRDIARSLAPHQARVFFLLVMILVSGIASGALVILSADLVHNAKLVVGVVGGIVFLLLTMRWPEVGIVSYVALLSGLIALDWLPSLHFGPISILIPDAILLILLGLVFVRATTQRNFVLIRSPLLLPLLLFIAAVLISAANAILIYDVRPNTVLRTVRMLTIWLVFIPTLQLVRSEQQLRRLWMGLVILAGVLLLGVLFPNRFSPLLIVEEVEAGTGAQTYSGFTRLYYAGDMVLYAMIPITLALLAMLKKGNPFWRIGLLGLLIFWVLRTFFREYWLTLLTVSLLLAIFLTGPERVRLFKRMVIAAVAGAVIVGILIASQPTQVERVAYMLGDRTGSLLRDPIRNEGSLQWRMIENAYAMQQISRHPVLGLGLANSYRPPMEIESYSKDYGNWTNSYIENGYLYITVMMGFVGLIPFLWLCIAYLLRVFFHQHLIQDAGLRAIYLGLGLGFLGMIVCNLTTPTFVYASRLVFFPFSMGMSEVILRLAREKKQARLD